MPWWSCSGSEIWKVAQTCNDCEMVAILPAVIVELETRLKSPVVTR